MATLREQTLMIGKQGAPIVSYQEEDAQCPVCKSDKYLTPDLKLLISPCFHKMCESCIERLFSTGPAPCPLCEQVLRKNQFMSQIFEDLAVEKEVRIRKRVSRVFNKRPEDFATLRLYNDYLEEIEDITFNLMNEVDVAETEAKVNQYEMDNRDIIARNQSRLFEEQRSESYKDKQAREDKERKHQKYLEDLEEERRQKEQDKADLIKELATSNKSAQAVLAARQTIALKRSSAVRKQEVTRSAMPSYITASMDFESDMKKESGEEIDPFSLEYEYPSVQIRDDYVDPATDYLKNNKSVRAGGYLAKFAHQRALDDAFSGLAIPAIENPS